MCWEAKCGRPKHSLNPTLLEKAFWQNRSILTINASQDGALKVSTSERKWEINIHHPPIPTPSLHGMIRSSSFDSSGPCQRVKTWSTDILDATNCYKLLQYSISSSQNASHETAMQKQGLRAQQQSKCDVMFDYFWYQHGAVLKSRLILLTPTKSWQRPAAGSCSIPRQKKESGSWT